MSIQIPKYPSVNQSIQDQISPSPGHPSIHLPSSPRAFQSYHVKIQLLPMVLVFWEYVWGYEVCKRTEPKGTPVQERVSYAHPTIHQSIGESIHQPVHHSNPIQPISKCLLMISCTRVKIQLYPIIATNSGFGFSDIWWSYM